MYYRLRVVTLKVPPLRERKEDIPILTRNFVNTFCENYKMETLHLPGSTVKWLCNYPWPGNVRELRNALEAGVILCRDGVLRPEDLHLSGLPEMGEKGLASDPPLSLEESERSTVLRALKEAKGVQKGAAELLGISRRTIHYKIKKLGIDVSQVK